VVQRVPQIKVILKVRLAPDHVRDGAQTRMPVRFGRALPEQEFARGRLVNLPGERTRQKPALDSSPDGCSP
jgi:hypothetical protein